MFDQVVKIHSCQFNQPTSRLTISSTTARNCKKSQIWIGLTLWRGSMELLADGGVLTIKKRFYDSQNVLKRSVKYNYNIRGWLTQIKYAENYSTDDLFALKLYYNEDISINEPRHNGNISFAKWQSSCPSGDCDPVFQGLKGYSYSYDKLNRLTDAVYYKGANMDRTSTYDESITAYDRNGNIQGLRRNGLVFTETTIDNLVYSYDGNQIMGIDDQIPKQYYTDFFDNGHYYHTTGVVEYTYDANGNLKSDLNKGIINITYNDLNLKSLCCIDF